MICVESLIKKFDNKTVLDEISLEINDGLVYGLLGSNGSGKSTLLRSIAGIYEPDGGAIMTGDKAVFENADYKNQIFLVSDEPFFFAQSSVNEMAAFYRKFYSNWDEEVFRRLCGVFPLNYSAKISTFSKGMKRQALIILSISTSPKYLLLDEAFDGLDPVMRNVLKSIIAEKIVDNAMSVVVSSHNINEFENMCDVIAILHKGKKILERNQNDQSDQITKVQIAFNGPPAREMFGSFNVHHYESRGNLATLTIRGERDEVESGLQAMNPIFMDIIPATLEEIFLYEMEGVGYDPKNIL